MDNGRSLLHVRHVGRHVGRHDGRHDERSCRARVVTACRDPHQTRRPQSDAMLSNVAQFVDKRLTEDRRNGKEPWVSPKSLSSSRRTGTHTLRMSVSLLHRSLVAEPRRGLILFAVIAAASCSGSDGPSMGPSGPGSEFPPSFVNCSMFGDPAASQNVLKCTGFIGERLV